MNLISPGVIYFCSNAVCQSLIPSSHSEPEAEQGQIREEANTETGRGFKAPCSSSNAA